MSRRRSGAVGVWAEMQRQQQRQAQAAARQLRERERQERAYQRQAAQDHKAYRQAEAARRTAELEARVAALQGLLATGCRAAPFRPDTLLRTDQVPPFDPGPLAHPVPMPDPGQFPAHGWTANARAQARARFEQAWYAAQAAEAQRQEQLAAQQRQYAQWAEGVRTEARRHNAGVAEAARGLQRGEPDAVVEYFTAALYASPSWPQEFPRQLSAAYDQAARQLVLDWELPGYGVVPEAKAVRWSPGEDQYRETARPVTQRRALYREAIAQSALLVLHELYAADTTGALESVALNGFADGPDPATGLRAQHILVTVLATRPSFTSLNLAQVDAVSCLTDALRGRLSARPDELTAVRPDRRPQDVGNRVVTHRDDDEPDLHAMDPIAFEELVAELLRAMGMEAVTTRRSGDGGVDVDATDPAPIRGGAIVVQVKRYRNTVSPTAVRDLYGTVLDRGANKGVLVTTSSFGPGSRDFATGKPLELISGPELVDLLHRHGLRGRLGDGTPPTDDGHNVLGMSWSGTVALDVCALVCQGGRVLSDDHFVFFNNPATPDGSVRALPPAAPDRASLRVAFDALPAAADRLVLVAAVDPETDPHADLAGFTDARIRLLDAHAAELGVLEVSDGRPGETALVLGSFRRRPTGDWDFVLGGKGYRDGLEELIRDFGLDVE
ncbi:restriction endonuclease [Streptomyces sp. V2]|uniref:restriction endonuclease n=1 Tax=Streptomyces TaxID=1883 RepID=UPI000D670F48|nr:restriction endonuclease [Streptomyces sp. V2]PWG12648.1 restriction endonuclease [Streptomyces sp. V2]